MGLTELNEDTQDHIFFLLEKLERIEKLKNYVFSIGAIVKPLLTSCS